jgi:hypothetical protein
MRIILHAGLHRTASSSFQRYLAVHRTDLLRLGILAVIPHDYRKNYGTLRDLLGERVEAIGAAAAAERIREIVALEKDRTDTLVLSDENLLGFMPGKAKQASAHRHLLAEIASHLGRDCEVRIMLVLREHAGYLSSLHSLGIMRGERASFEDFVDGIEPASLLLSPLLKEVRSACGAAAMSIFSLEDISLDGGTNFLAQLSRLTGNQLPGAGLPKVGASLPWQMLALLRDLAARDIIVAQARTEKFARLANAHFNPVGRKKVGRKLASLIAASAVHVPLDIHGRLRREFAAKIVSSGGNRNALPIGIREAEGFLKKAFAGKKADLFPGELMNRLWRRFAADRREISETYLPEWVRLRPPDGQNSPI